MSETTTPVISKKRFAWLAMGLSILMPGVGQIYCGKLARGLSYGLLYGVAVPTALGLLAYVGPASTVLLGFLMIAATLGIVIVATGDAYRLARRTRPDYALKVYNCPAIYILLGLMIQGSCLGYTLHIRSSLFEAFRIPSLSEYPTIVPNDRVLVDKTAYRKTDPGIGETVLFHPPDRSWRIHYIKRIVALAGDTIKIENGLVYVNGKELPRRRIRPENVQLKPTEGLPSTVEGVIYEETNGAATYRVLAASSEGNPGRDLEETAVPPHHCFVLGDNRDNSWDSRDFGPLPYATIEGRVDYIYWPADRWSRFGRLR